MNRPRRSARTVLLLLACSCLLAACNTARKYSKHIEYKGEKSEQPIPQ